MLPLAVGNSWEYQIDISLYQGGGPKLLIPISITHTEEIDGIAYSGGGLRGGLHTYYVFSDLPDRMSRVKEFYAPVPFFFLAGKKVRWSSDGKALFILAEWNQETEVFRFDGDYKVREIYRLFPTLLGSRNNYLSLSLDDWCEFPPGYPYTTDGFSPPFAGYPDHSVTVESSFSEEGTQIVEFRFPTRIEFTHSSGGLGEFSLSATFAEGLGLFAASGEADYLICNPFYSDPTVECSDDIYPELGISLRLESAVIGDVPWTAGEPIPTAVQEHSWGAMKDLVHK